MGTNHRPFVFSTKLKIASKIRAPPTFLCTGQSIPFILDPNKDFCNNNE